MSIEFGLDGLDELKKDLEKCITEYPDETNKAINRFANQFTKDVDAKMPPDYQKGKKHLVRNWKKDKRNNLRVATEIEIRNKGAHFHLVENGHRKFDFNGKDTGGFVAGKHYAEKTREEWRESYPEKVQEFVDNILKENNL